MTLYEAVREQVAALPPCDCPVIPFVDGSTYTAHHTSCILNRIRRDDVYQTIMEAERLRLVMENGATTDVQGYFEPPFARTPGWKVIAQWK